MDFEQVKSSYIDSVYWDKQTHVLRVRFKSGSLWEYASVTPEKYKAMMTAKSVGEYFITNIRDSHDSFCVLKPGREASKKSDKCDVASPIYLVLSTVKKERAGLVTAGFSYQVWRACGAPEKAADTQAGRLYNACVLLITEAGNGEYGEGHLEAAIKLAKERKV